MRRNILCSIMDMTSILWTRSSLATKPCFLYGFHLLFLRSPMVGNNRNHHHQHRTNSLPRHVSMVASSIMRHQMNNNVSQGDESLQDLSLQSLQWLESRGLYETNSKQNSRRASLPEQIQANGYYR